MGSMNRKTAAVGFRCHSGWAAAIALAGTAGAPEVVGRFRLTLADPAVPGSKQPFHAAEGMPFPEARRYIDRCTRRTAALARRELRSLFGELSKTGHRVVVGGLLRAAGRKLPDLATILRSHALIHAAEGEFFRDALARAAAEHRVPIVSVAERSAFREASDALHRPEVEVRRFVSETGRPLGPPWTQDQKLAALAAWMGLAARRT